MNINLAPAQKRIVEDELKSGHFRTVEGVISQALQVLRTMWRSHEITSVIGQADAVRDMLTFVQKNRVRLEEVSVKQLIHEGHRLCMILSWMPASRSSGSLKTKPTRKYSLAVPESLSKKRPLVPFLWFYEVGNGLVMALPRGRISSEQLQGFLLRLKALPIDVAQQTPDEVLESPALAKTYGLTNYDAAYLALAIRSELSLATTDTLLRKVSAAAAIKIFAA